MCSLVYPGHDHKRTGLENEAFLWSGGKVGEEYRFSVSVCPKRASSEKIRIENGETHTNADRHVCSGGTND